MDIRGRAALAGAALLLPFLPACSSVAAKEGPLPAERRVVHEMRPGAARLEPVQRISDSEANSAADRAEAQVRDGDLAGALETARAALLRLPTGEPADRLRAIRTKARKGFVLENLACAEAEAPARITEGTTLAVKVCLRNLSPAPLVVGEPVAGDSPTTAILKIVRTARDIRGTVRSDTWEETAPILPGKAPPGGALAVEIPLDTARFRDLVPQGFVVYSFEGSILPSALRAGEVEIHERLPLDGATTLAFPQTGWEEVAADPKTHLDRGFAEGNPVRILLAAACLPPENRRTTGSALFRRLREQPALNPVVEASVRAALRYLGDDPDADAWPADRWSEAP